CTGDFHTPVWTVLPRQATSRGSPTLTDSRRAMRVGFTYAASADTMALLRCRSRFFDQCGHIARVRQKDGVAARKLDDLRFGPLRHESLEVRVDHPVLHGNDCVARLLFPRRNRGLSLEGLGGNRHLGYRHETRDRLGNVSSEIIRKLIGV